MIIHKRPIIGGGVVVGQDPYVNTISDHDEMPFTRAEKVYLSRANIDYNSKMNKRIVVDTYSEIAALATGEEQKEFFVRTDETNSGNPTFYFYDGVGVYRFFF